MYKKNGGLDANELAEKARGRVLLEDSEREFAALHRMGKIAFENRAGQFFIRPK